MTRREFFIGAAATAAAGCVSATGADKPVVDQNLSVFLSDIHISGLNVKGQPTYQNPLLDKVLDQILAMNPRPARALVFGDVALWNGWAADYAESAPKLKRLSDAGIEVTVTTGNHDHREPLFAAYPRQKDITPVPGRVTSKVDLGTADFLLLDSLNENPKGEGTGNKVDGTLDDAQAAWLMKTAAEAKRPFFVGCHHPPQEVLVTVGSGKKAKKVSVLAALEDNPNFAGYVHGHNHRWYRNWFHKGYSKRHVVRYACLPSTGWWGTIGFATFSTFADRAESTLAPGHDFFFPKPLAEGERRPPMWDEIKREDAASGACTFLYAH